MGLKNYTWESFQWLFLLWCGAAVAGMLLTKKLPRVFLFLALLFSFCLGLVSGTGAGYAKLEVGDFFYKKVKITGSVEPLSVKHNEFGNSCYIHCEKIVSEKLIFTNTVKVRISTKNTLPKSGKIMATGQFLPLHILRNPGTFDMETWNRVQGFAGRIRKAEIKTVAEEESYLRQFLSCCSLINLSLRERMASVIQGDAGAVFAGMILGGSNGISEETREIFSANGLNHLLSVSGTHILLLSSFIIACLKPLKTKKKGIVVLGVLIFYAFICGLRPPVLRALIMSLPVLFVVPNVERGIFLIVTAVFLLLFQPLWLLDVGFQLSFLAAGGIIWLVPKLKPYCRLLFPKFIAEILTITIGAQLATLPLLVAYFHQISFLSLVASVVLLPVLEILVPFAVVGLAMDYMFAITMPLELCGIALEQILNWAEMLTAVPFSRLILPILPLWCGIVYYIFLMFGFYFAPVQYCGLQWRKAVMLLCPLLIVAQVAWLLWHPHSAVIHFVDVGQGDATLFVSKNNKVIFVDTGGSYGYDVGSRVLVPVLYAMGLDKVDLLVLSHGDLDHAGGAAGLVRNVPVEKIVLPLSAVTESVSNLLKVADKSEIIYAKDKMEFMVDDVVVRILQTFSGKTGNENCLVCELQSGDKKILFTGDINGEQERILNLQGSYTILKAPHHGSKYSNSEELYNRVKPKITVISVGRDNGYGHPHREALERMKNSGTKIYRTDEVGMVSFQLAN
ncbi:MAG: DNA internalization-related competence protein ComEC/Rec2 [Phascolarctobacterium sp.]|nr:DNA internalization-related competence protein ComEC/Rec2 [Phascolarctobacterium sp.]